MKRACDKCNKLAVWNYAPGKGDIYYCEGCVPRGCSCQMDDEGKQFLDLEGREQPCCEYNYSEKGFKVEL